MFIVEGLIGAGKTTFLHLIEKYIPSLQVVYEPVGNWETEKGGHSLLANFYTHTQRWAYSFELATLMQRVYDTTTQLAMHPHSLYVFERSLYSGHYCFAYNSFKQGFISEMEWHVYQEWFNFLVTKIGKVPRGFIYLQVDPLIAYKRLKKRNRSAESELSYEYLTQIHTAHESFLVTNREMYPLIKEVPVLILNVDNDFHTYGAHTQDLMHQVTQFISINSLS